MMHAQYRTYGRALPFSLGLEGDSIRMGYKKILKVSNVDKLYNKLIIISF